MTMILSWKLHSSIMEFEKHVNDNFSKCVEYRYIPMYTKFTDNEDYLILNQFINETDNIIETIAYIPYHDYKYSDGVLGEFTLFVENLEENGE